MNIGALVDVDLVTVEIEGEVSVLLDLAEPDRLTEPVTDAKFYCCTSPVVAKMMTASYHGISRTRGCRPRACGRERPTCAFLTSPTRSSEPPEDADPTEWHRTHEDHDLTRPDPKLHHRHHPHPRSNS